MTIDHGFLTEIEIARLEKESLHYGKFRDYEAEDKFISEMEDLSFIRGLRAEIIVRGDNAKMVGLHIVFHGESDNDN